MRRSRPQAELRKAGWDQKDTSERQLIKLFVRPENEKKEKGREGGTVREKKRDPILNILSRLKRGRGEKASSVGSACSSRRGKKKGRLVDWKEEGRDYRPRKMRRR